MSTNLKTTSSDYRIGKMTEYSKTYTSFAGTDIVATITMPPQVGGDSYILGALQTISYSIHREVVPVRAIGRVSPLGFTAGQRTIGGSLIFTVFNKNVANTLKDILVNTTNWERRGLLDDTRKSSLSKEAILMDELPPFDITITMKNEYGQLSYLVISGIVIVDEGQVMSIEDMIVENTYSYMARDITPLTPYE